MRGEGLLGHASMKDVAGAGLIVIVAAVAIPALWGWLRGRSAQPLHLLWEKRRRETRRRIREMRWPKRRPRE
jgi:hypothetical protein